jgi:hypothetical protein
MPKFRKRPVVIEAFRLSDAHHPIWAIQAAAAGILIANEEGTGSVVTLEVRCAPTSAIGSFRA